MHSTKATDSAFGSAHRNVRATTRKLNAKVLTYFSQYEGEQLRLLRQHLLDLTSTKERYTAWQLKYWQSARSFFDQDAPAFNAAFLTSLEKCLNDEIQSILRDSDSDSDKRGPPTTQAGDFRQGVTLSLMAAEDMDRMLSRDEVVQRFNARYDETLTPLTLRLRTLFGCEVASLQCNPYRPEILVRAFLLALKNCSFDEAAAQAVLLAFDPQHSIDLEPLYAELGRILDQSGVTAQTHRLRKTSGSDSGYSGAGGAAGPPASGFAGFAPSAPMPGFSGFAPSAPMPGYGATGYGAAGYGYAAPGWTAASHARDFLHKLGLNQPGALGYAAGTVAGTGHPLGWHPGPTGAAPGLLPIDPFMAAYLEELQAEVIESFAYRGLDIDLGSENILREMRMHEEIRSAPELDRGTVDALAEVFDFVFTDPSIPAPLKIIIGRLQIPVLKAAMMDREFFFSASHPARRLIDALAAASVAWTPEKGLEDSLYLQIEATVKRVLTEFDRDLALFSEVLLEFEEYVADAAQEAQVQVERVASAEEQQEALESARGHADEVLHERIGAWPDERDKTAFLLPFLTTQWREVLARAWIHPSSRSAQWEQLLLTTDQLLWSTRHKRDSAERAQLVAVLPGLVRQLYASLDALGWQGSERETFTRRLIATHMSAIRSTPDASQEAASDSQDLRAGDEAVWRLDQRRAAAQAVAPDDFDAMARGFERGMWFDFLGDEARSHRCRLTWISPKRTRFLFTNREGFDAFVRTEREVTDLLRQGRLKVLSQVPIVARALNQILATPEAVPPA